MTLDPYLTLDTEINSKQIKDLNIRSETREILEESTEKILDISTGNISVPLAWKAQAPKAKINTRQVTLHSFYTAEETRNKTVTC